MSPESATFDKADPADVVLTVSSTVPNSVESVEVNGSTLATENYTVDGLEVTIKTTYLAVQTNAAYVYTIQLAQGDDVTSTITVSGTA